MPENSSPKTPHKMATTTTTKRLRLIGFCLGVFGIFYAIFCDVLFNSLLERALTLRPNSKIFEVWKAPPLKLTLDVYFFNWTNPDDFGNFSVKPILEEVGPYRFIEVPKKVDIAWHPENASVSYRKKSLFHFVEEESSGSLLDKIVTMNTIAVAVGAKTRYWSPIRSTIIDLALKVYRDQMKITKTVDELLFTGYNDILLDIANTIPASISDLAVPFSKFGYTHPRNGSAEVAGVFNIFTGADDIGHLGRVHSWNHKESTNFYPQECAKLYGSTGEFQGPYLRENEGVDYFLPDFCRPITLDYVETSEIDGMKGLKYAAGQKAVDNGTVYPENECYCNGRCVPSGLINISSCWFGAPVFMSYPHFYNADPYYLEQLDGLKPEKDKHEFYVVLEQKTGLALEVSARFQVNVLVEPMPHLNMFRDQRKIFFPLFWFEERTRVTPDLTSELKLVPRLIFASRIFGILCLLIGIALIYWHRVMAHFRLRLQRKIYAVDKENATRTVSKISSIIVDQPKPDNDNDLPYFSRL